MHKKRASLRGTLLGGYTTKRLRAFALDELIFAEGIQ